MLLRTEWGPGLRVSHRTQGSTPPLQERRDPELQGLLLCEFSIGPIRNWRRQTISIRGWADFYIEVFRDLPTKSNPIGSPCNHLTGLFHFIPSFPEGVGHEGRPVLLPLRRLLVASLCGDHRQGILGKVQGLQHGGLDVA